jgi:3-phosphoshikimate 1-carboxyvinyltransferase
MTDTLTIRGTTPKGQAGLSGEARVPGDKSISHRALILGALAHGTNQIEGWLEAGDTLATLGALRALGVAVQKEGDRLTFQGGNLKPPPGPLDCVNAGTAMRLLAGLLAGQPFASVLDGSPQLRRRPMGRITTPLRAMGARIADMDGYPPLTIEPAQLKGETHHLKVASAQVKSAILLAGLHAEGSTAVIEPGPSRDHTERMLHAMGAHIAVDGRHIDLTPDHARLEPLCLTVPGDLSSAAFLIVAASIVLGSDVRIVGVGLNPTRAGLLDILARMGASIDVEERTEQGGEPTGTLRVRYATLQGTTVAGDEVVRAIDELPILAVAATQAVGETRIKDAAELRLKEVDRIALLAQELRTLGAEVEEFPDGMAIYGPAPLSGASVSSHGDHRLGMALAIAGLVADGDTLICDAECIADSYPGFAEALARLGAGIRL